MCAVAEEMPSIGFKPVLPNKVPGPGHEGAAVKPVGVKELAGLALLAEIPAVDDVGHIGEDVLIVADPLHAIVVSSTAGR